MRLPFTKMQGLGNDFIVLDQLEGRPRASSGAAAVPSSERITPELAIRLCDRRFGIGADQILWLRPPQAAEADARMEIFNSDGSVAEMCGNGIRAVAVYLRDHGPRPGEPAYAVETLGGMKRVTFAGQDGGEVVVDMGVPTLGAKTRVGGESLEAEGARLTFLEVGMGNPHAVIFVDDVARYPVERLGPAVEHHPRFPQRTNVEFVEVLSAGEIRVRVWERGAGITLACGTGACASAVASLLSGRVQGEVKVNLPGGALKIRWKGEGEPVFMQGPAQEVFRGEVEV